MLITHNLRSRAFVWSLLAVSASLAQGPFADAADWYWDINGDVLYGDGGVAAWRRSNTGVSWTSNASGTTPTVGWLDANSGSSVQFGFGPLPDNTTSGGLVEVGHSSNGNQNPLIGSLILNASGASPYTFANNDTNLTGPTITINTGGSGVPAGVGMLVNDNVVGDTRFIVNPGSAAGATFKVTLGANQTWRNNSPTYGVIMDVPVVGSYALTTDGTGLFAFNALNSFTSLAVASGTARVGHANALSTGPVTVASGGTLDVRATITKDIGGDGRLAIGPGGSLTSAVVGPVALTMVGISGSTAAFTTTATGTVSLGSVTLGGDARLGLDVTTRMASAGPVTISGTNNLLSAGGVAPAGTYTLVEGSSLSVVPGSISLTGAAVGNIVVGLGSTGTFGRSTYSFTSTANALQLAVTGSQATLTWAGTGTATTWNYNVANPNWSDGAASTFFNVGDNAVFNAAATVAIRPAGISADAVSVTNASGTVTLGGGGLIATSLTKSAAGVLALSGSGIISPGVVTVSGGELAVTGSGVLAATSLVNNAVVSYSSVTAQTLGATLSGTGLLTQAGSGRLTLAGASDYDGTFSIAASSTLELGSTSRLGVGGTYARGIAISGELLLSNTGAQVFVGPLSGAGTLTKAGSGLVTLAGTSSAYTGPVNITVGTLRLDSSGALGATAGSTSVASGGTLDLGGQSISSESVGLVGTGVNVGGALVNSNTTTVASWGGTVSLNSVSTGVGGDGSMTINGPVSGGGGLTKYGEGTVTLAGGNSYAGTLTINAGTVRAVNQAALPGGNLGWANSSSSSTLDLVASGTYTMAAITQFGSILRVVTSGPGQVSLVVGGDSTLTGNATKTLQTGTNVRVILNGGIAAAAATQNRDVRFYNGGEIELNGMITGGGSTYLFGLVQTATTGGQNGTLFVNAMNFHNGETRVSAGMLKVGNAMALGDTASGTRLDVATQAVVTESGTTIQAIPGVNPGTLDLNGYSVSGEGLILQGTYGRPRMINSAAATPVVWSGTTDVIDGGGVGGAGDIDMQGVISGSTGTLAKIGPGTVTLSAATTFTGTLAAEEGRLVVAATGGVGSAAWLTTSAGGTLDLTALGTYAVPSAQTIGGSGTVAGDLVVGSGATLSPGASPGTLTLSGSVTFASGGNYNWQMLSGTGTAGAASAWDLVSIGGPLTIAATSADPFKIDLWTLSGTGPDVNGPASGVDPYQNYSWKIATATGGITGFAADKFLINTSATNGTSGFANAYGSGTFSLAQSGNDLNLVFTAGPAPTEITINVPSGTQTQTQAGYPILSGSIPLLKTGAGTLVLDQANTLSGSTTVQGGVLQLANGTALGSSTLAVVAGATAQVANYQTTSVAGLDLAGNGLVDVNNGFMTVSSGLSATALVAEILEGRGDGSWTGTSGITSSAAAANVALGVPRTVGWLDNGNGSVSFAFAAAGDTNLDWQVDVIDAANIITAGKFNTGGAATWSQGDFNYDGIVNLLDAADFLTTGLYNQGSYNSPPSAGGAVAAVPEPAGMAILLTGGVALALRYRRKTPTVSRL